MKANRPNRPGGVANSHRDAREGPGGGGTTRASRTTWILLLGILLLGGLLRGIYLADFAKHPDFTVPQVDADYHNYWARGLAFGDWTLRGGNEDPRIQSTPYFRPPGYPYFLAALYRITGPGYVGPRVIQFALGLLNVLLAFFLARRIFGRTAGLLSALFMATYWVYIFYEGEFQEPVLLTTLVLGLLLVLSRWLSRPGPYPVFGAGLIIGGMGLVRPSCLLLLPSLGLWMLWLLRRQGRIRSLLGSLALLVAGSILVVVPATIRNWVVARDFVPISTNGGINLYIGNNPAATGLVYAMTDVGVLDTCYDWPGIVANTEKKLGRKLTDSQVSRYFADEAVAYILRHPGSTLKTLAQKTLLYWGPAEPADNKEVHAERRASPVLRLNPWNFGIALGLGLTGILMILWAARRPKATGDRHAPPYQTEMVVAFWIVIGIWYLSFLPFGITSRYRVPTIPLLMIFGSYVVVEIVKAWRTPARKQAAAWVGILTGLTILANVDFAGYKPSFARWHYQRGLADNVLGRRAAAIAEFRAALKENPNYTAAYNDLGASLAMEGKTAESIPCFIEAVRRGSHDPVTHCNLAAALELEGRLAESLAEYERALAIRPDYPRAAEGLARVRARLRATPAPKGS
jgi:4-amino-4-deoxy-L-arabinose transferase-like glycosyltransferase